MVKIRLARIGKKKMPTYRLVVSDSKKDTLGTFLENVGSYDPRTKKIELKTDRIKEWLQKGAQPSETVHNLLVENSILQEKKVKASKISKKRQEKMSANKKEKESENTGKLETEKQEKK